MAGNVSRAAMDKWAAGIRRQPARVAQPDRSDWTRLPHAQQLILRLLHRHHEMLPAADLRKMLQLPDLDQHLNDLRRYVQRVWIKSAPGSIDGGPNGVALTVAGADLVRWEAEHNGN